MEKQDFFGWLSTELGEDAVKQLKEHPRGIFIINDNHIPATGKSTICRLLRKCGFAVYEQWEINNNTMGFDVYEQNELNNGIHLDVLRTKPIEVEKRRFLTMYDFW